MLNDTKQTRGFTLTEVLVVIVVMTLVFGSLFVSFEYSLRLIGHSRAKLTALSLSTDRLEYIRSLPYASVGTVLGIPSGAIPQTRTVSLNGINFAERVLIEFIDDDADGLLGADSNGIISDYKRIKVEYTWTIHGTVSTSTAVSTIVPRSIETNSGGGSLRVNVFNAGVTPLAGIDVRLRNTEIATPIDVTRQTDGSGAALFTGAPAGANYEIFVSEVGYSSDQTYKATTTLPNPSTLPVAILESDVSTMNFQIDKVSKVNLRFISAETLGSRQETFNDFSAISASTSVMAVAGELHLQSTSGLYAGTGEVWLNAIEPATIESWGVTKLEAVIPTATDVRLQFYTSTNTADIIDDTNLPGNSIGFNGTYIDLRMLDGATFPKLIPRIILQSTDTGRTPQVRNISFGYIESTTAAAGQFVSVNGSKVIGTLSDSSPVYKFSSATTTNSLGEVRYKSIEWDEYNITPNVGGQIVSEVCPGNPFSVKPDSNINVLVKLLPFSSHNLRVAVTNGAGEPVIDAVVILTRGAGTTARDTSWCGQTFFSTLTTASDYALEVSAPGYVTNRIDPITVNGITVQKVILVAS